MIRNVTFSSFNFCVAVSVLTNLLMSVVLNFATYGSYTVFLTTSLSISLLSLLKTGEAVFRLSISILSTSASKLAKSDVPAKLDVSTSVAPFKSAFVA